MHRDQKIGLSLAVLIVGFTAAFCFRNEPLRDAQPLALDQAAAIDARIEQLPIRAYTQREGVGGIFQETELLNPAADVIDVSLIDRPAQSMEVGTPLTGDVIDLFAGPPEPLAAEQKLIAPAGQSSRDVDRGQSTEFVMPATTSRPESLPQPPVARHDQLSAAASADSSLTTARTYVVKSGDTLSGVSHQMYGNSSRFLDIYRANRDVLNDPNNLPVGTTLQIP